MSVNFIADLFVDRTAHLGRGLLLMSRSSGGNTMTRQIGTTMARGQRELCAASVLVGSEDSIKGEELAEICHLNTFIAHGYRYVGSSGCGEMEH
jgi:hypothetical protein